MTNLEMQTLVRDDLSIEAGDHFYADAYIQRVINRAVKWFCALHYWQETQFAYYRDSVVDQEYYNYPQKFRTDSIMRLKFDSETYDKTNFQEYLEYQEEHGGSASDKIWADYRRQYFINPVPSTVARICIWGHLVPDDMSDDADTHPFAGNQDAEEAMCKYALGIALKKGRGSLYDKGVAEQNGAKAIADAIWERQKKEQAKYQTKEIEMFKWQPILPPNGGERRTQRGNFETC